MRSRHYRAFAWGRHGQRDRKFGQTDGFYLVKTKERIFRVYFNTVKMPQCSVPGCTEMGAKYMHFTRWRGLFFFPTRAHSFFSTPLAVGEWSMTDIHLHETNPKQLMQWWAPIRRELTVPYHGGATWGDFSAGTSLQSPLLSSLPPQKKTLLISTIKSYSSLCILTWPCKEPSIPPNGWKIGDEKMSSYFLEILQLCAATPHPGNLDQGPNTHLRKFNQSWPCTPLVGGGKHKRWRHWLGLVQCEHIIAAMCWAMLGIPSVYVYCNIIEEPSCPVLWEDAMVSWYYQQYSKS